VIKTDTVRQLELVVIFEPVHPNSFLFDRGGVSGCEGGIL
jgi:hypothetical protein